jgi:putative adenylate-forming enzyme
MSFKKFKIIKQFFSTKDFTNREKLDRYKAKKLQNLLLHLESKFYPNSTNLEDYPIINKKIFMDNFEKINSKNIKYDQAIHIALKAENSRDFTPKIKGVTVGLSSGTSGSRGIFLVSEDETALWAGYILRRMLPKPILQQHKIAFFLRANSNLYETVNSSLISFQFYDLMIPLKQHVKQLNQTQPTILIAPAQVLRLLTQDKALNIKPKKIISVAEVLEDDDKYIIENRFKQIVHQVYQCTEGFLAHTCQYGNLHLNEDIVHIEKAWLDKEHTRFSPIITDYNRTSQPVIRYKLDDILLIDNKPCPCGSAFQKIKKIEGRCDDILKMITVDNQAYDLFPDFISRAIISVDGIVEYKVIKTDDKLNIYLQPLECKDKVDISLKTLYKTHNLRPLKHKFLEYEQMPLQNKRRRVEQL